MQQAATKQAVQRALRTVIGASGRYLFANKAARVPAAIAGVALTALAVAGLVSGPRAALSIPNSLGSSTVAKTAVKTILTAASEKTVTPAEPAGRRSVGFYTRDVRASMFSEPVAPAPVEKVEVVKPVPVAPVHIDPYADWNYTGNATIGSDRVAMLENINSHDVIMLHVGDRFLDKTVASIDDKFLTFGKGATSKALYISMNTNYAPLNATADYLKPQAPQKNQNAITFVMGGQPAAPANGPSVTLPNGTVLSGTALDRYNRRLNRGWNTNGGSGTNAAPGGRGNPGAGRRGGGGGALFYISPGG